MKWRKWRPPLEYIYGYYVSSLTGNIRKRFTQAAGRLPQVQRSFLASCPTALEVSRRRGAFDSGLTGILPPFFFLFLSRPQIAIVEGGRIGPEREPCETPPSSRGTPQFGRGKGRKVRHRLCKSRVLGLMHYHWSSGQRRGHA